MSDPTDERFLVTGALGCIGAWTVRQLVAEGSTVVTFDKGGDARRLRLVMDPASLARVTMLEGDIADLAAIERVLDEHAISHVIHLAALQVPFARADPPLGALVNVVGTVNVLEAVKRHRARHDPGGDSASLDRGAPGHDPMSPGGGAPVVYAGSIGMFAATDADPVDGSLHEDAVAHPINHYGVYKLANEGNARIYWQDDGLPSIGLRPMVIYGPGRDQGMTSGPTRATLAAVLGRELEIPFGGRVLFQYAPDAAAAFIAASRSGLDGARVYNLGGTLASIDELIASIERVVPGARDLIRHTGQPLPFPEAIESTSLAELGDVPVTPLAEAVAQSVALFRDRIDRGELLPEAHGLTA